MRESSDSSALERLLARVLDGVGAVTNPEHMRAIMQPLALQQLKTGNDQLDEILRKASSEPVDLTSFQAQLLYSLQQDPVLCQLATDIEKNHWLSDKELAANTDVLCYLIYSAWLTENLTLWMLNDATVAKNVIEHVFSQRACQNPGSTWDNFWHSTHRQADMFDRVKLVSVDGPAYAFLLERLYGEKPSAAQRGAFVKKYALTGLNAKAISGDVSTNIGLSLNILEAVASSYFTDKQHCPALGAKQFEGNRIAGMALILLLERKRYAETEYRGAVRSRVDMNDMLHGLGIESATNRLSTMAISPAWECLYNNWNRIFVSHKLPALIVIQKLFLPSVMQAAPGTYVKARTLSLWLTVSHYFNVLRSSAVQQQVILGKPTRLASLDFVMDRWSELTRQYAESIVRRETGVTSQRLKLSYLYYFSGGLLKSITRLFAVFLQFILGAKNMHIALPRSRGACARLPKRTLLASPDSLYYRVAKQQVLEEKIQAGKPPVAAPAVASAERRPGAA